MIGDGDAATTPNKFFWGKIAELFGYIWANSEKIEVKYGQN